MDKDRAVLVSFLPPGWRDSQEPSQGQSGSIHNPGRISA